MNQKFIAQAETIINAPAARVWEALTTPELIKQYLFGTDVHTDWQVGSPITYTGEWEGKQYEDKGTILEVQPERLLVSTYWSSMSKLPDLPENYKNVRYELSPEGEATKVTIVQDNNKTQEEADHTTKNWNMVLSKLKEVVEK